MVGVKNDGDVVKLGDLTDVLGSSDAPSNAGGVVGVVGGLSGNELTTSLGESDHDGASVNLGGLHAGIDGVGSNNIDSGDSETLLLGVCKKVNKSLSGYNTGIDRGRKLGESLRFVENAKLKLDDQYSRTNRFSTHEFLLTLVSDEASVLI
jgi:hypothetical protein